MSFGIKKNWADDGKKDQLFAKKKDILKKANTALD